MRLLAVFFALVMSCCCLVSGLAFAGLSQSADRADVNDTGYSATVIAVGTSEVEAKVGGTRDGYRQRLLIYNDSSNVIYYGPTGVTTTGSTRGVPIYKRQVAIVPVGDVAVYLIAGSAANDVIIQELK